MLLAKCFHTSWTFQLHSIQRRSFHATSIAMEDRYAINGTEITRTDILKMKPQERSVAHWQVLVDWDRQGSRPFVVLDPFDPTGLLYLSQAEYLSQAKVAASTDLPVLVIARPGTKAPFPIGTSSSQNSPLPVGIETKWTRQSRASWKTFLEFRSRIRRALPVVARSTMVSESSRSVHRTVYLWARELAHYTEVKNSGMIPSLLQPLASKLASLLDHNGQGAAVQYLKVSLFVLYSFMAGNPLRSTVPLGWGIRLRSGLPADWPVALRSKIRSGNLPLIRIMASLLNLYRAMDAKHPPFSTKTIEQAHPNLEEVPDFKLYQEFCTEIFPTLLALRFPDGDLPPFEYKTPFGLMMRSAGANYSPAMASMVEDAQAWASQPVNYIQKWFRLHKDKTMEDLVHQLSMEHVPTPSRDSPSSLNGYMMACRPSGPRQGSDGPILGRLHTIDEPAGKVRVVAICDYFTQAGLKPVHDYLFSILKQISQDATFAQDKTVEAYYRRGLSPHWSFDLKSATDLIPLALYKEVLGPLLRRKGETMEQGRSRADLWAKIIADRDFALPNDGKTKTRFVRYGTGQPMGALSSWASMALVHHSLVQFSHWKATRVIGWYTDYLVLGDDVDIARLESVATAYKDTCHSFSIIIGLHKSLSSSVNCFEFANRRFHPLGDISPISFREELSARTWTTRWEFAKRICSRLGKPISEVPAVLRRAVTSAQWNAILPELGGKRPLSLVRLVRYCLLNPLQITNDLNEVRISHLLNWLADALDENQARVARSVRIDTEQGRQLERSLAHFLLGEIGNEFSKMLSSEVLRKIRMVSPPTTRFPDSQSWDERKEREIPADALGINSLWRVIHGTISVPLPPQAPAYYQENLEAVDNEVMRYLQRREAPNYYAPDSPIAWVYFLACVSKHNTKVLQDIFEIWEEFNRLSRRTPHLHSPVHSEKFYPNGYPNLVGPLLEIWIKLRSTSQLIHYDLNKSVKVCLKTDLELEELLQSKLSLKDFREAKVREWRRAVEPEIVYGPMSQIASFLALELGVVMSNVPFFALSQRPGHWTRSLNRAFALFEKRRILLERYRLSQLLGSRLNSYTALRAFAQETAVIGESETRE
nr:MAG: putative RNA-dependent RNA polymerase [Mitoviridae sp.]